MTNKNKHDSSEESSTKVASEFLSDSHFATLSDDGSYTAFSVEYNEHYHSTKDGALSESLNKHVIPAFKIKMHQSEINILDICFGLGFNTLATLYFVKKNSLSCHLNIYSPELDVKLIDSLENFTYPEEFKELKEIVTKLIKDGFYRDEQLFIELFLGDAREYITKFEDKFDIVYQDAFSPSANPALWTFEYFNSLAKTMKKDAVLTTYSISLPTRIALFENGFNLYLNSGDGFRDSTVASRRELDEFLSVDVEHKMRCNPEIKALRDRVKTR